MIGHHLIDCILQREIDTDPRGLGPLTLLLHLPLESCQINIKALLFGNFLSEFQGEAVGVIELKRLCSADLFGLALQKVCQKLLPTLQGVQKARLLPLKPGQEQLLALNHLRMGVLEECDRSLSHRLERRLVAARFNKATKYTNQA